MSKNVGEEVEWEPPQSWLLNDINKTQGEMEIPGGDSALCVYVCAWPFVSVQILHIANVVLGRERLPFLRGTAVQELLTVVKSEY